MRTLRMGIGTRADVTITASSHTPVPSGVTSVNESSVDESSVLDH